MVSSPAESGTLSLGLCGCRVLGGDGGSGGGQSIVSPPPLKCDMQKLTVDELKRLLYDTFCEHLSMKDIENIIMTEEESHLGTAEECPVDVESESHLGSLRRGQLLEGEEAGACRGGWGLPCLPQACAPLGTSPRAEMQVAPDSDALLSPSVSLWCSLAGGHSLFQPADSPDMCAQESDLRLRHRLHH